MKRNFLLMLLLTLLPLASWSATVKVGDLTVTQSANYVVYVAPTLTPPEITGFSQEGWTKVEGVFVYNAATFKYEPMAPLTAESPAPWGTYFQKIVNGDKTLYVPFQVGATATTDNYDIIRSEESFTASLDGKGLAAYYAKYPYCDLWTKEGNHVFDPTPAQQTSSFVPDFEVYERTWASANAAPKGPEGYAWCVPYGFETKVRPVFSYTYSSGKQSVIPWGLGAIREVGAASLPFEFNDPNFIAGTWWKSARSQEYWADATSEFVGDEAPNAFNEELFSMTVIPEIAAFPLAPTVEYMGENTEGPGFVVVGEGTAAEGYTFVGTIKNRNTNEVGIKGVGQYFYVVKIIKKSRI